MKNEIQSIARGAAALDQMTANIEAITLFDEKGREKSQATILIELSSTLELFHDDDRNGYAVISSLNGREVWPIESLAFRSWLSQQYYELTEKGVTSKALNDAITTINAKALYSSLPRKVFQRTASVKERIYIDLADDKWRVIEIDAHGWRILESSPVMFVRRPGMAPLPAPVNGSLTDLATILNVYPEDMPLVYGWLLTAARGSGPYPILALQGEQGTGKSTVTRMLRNLVDPSVVPLRGLNRDMRDFLVTARNNHVIVLDNLSGISAEMSDLICRISTGGGFAERRLYTNSEEVIVDMQRPVILNGIDEIATRGDLVDRALILQLPFIADFSRNDEESIWRRYEEMRPGLIGGLCTVLSYALRNYPNTKLATKPRMADFALWGSASEGALGFAPGIFMAAYFRNRDLGIQAARESLPFADAIEKLMGELSDWSGTATELMNEAERVASASAKRSPAWPRTGKGASNALSRAAPVLRRIGIEVSIGNRSTASGQRIVKLTNLRNYSSVRSVSSDLGSSENLATSSGISFNLGNESVMAPATTVDTDDTERNDGNSYHSG